MIVNYLSKKQLAKFTLDSVDDFTWQKLQAHLLYTDALAFIEKCYRAKLKVCIFFQGDLEGQWLKLEIVGLIKLIPKENIFIHKDKISKLTELKFLFFSDSLCVDDRYQMLK